MQHPWKNWETLFHFQIEPLNDKVAMWNQIVCSERDHGSIKRQFLTAQFPFLLYSVTVILWWQVISESFMPHCALMVLFVCGCPSRDVFSGTTFNFHCESPIQQCISTVCKVRRIHNFTIFFKHRKRTQSTVSELFHGNSILKTRNSESFIIKNIHRPDMLVNEIPICRDGGHGCLSLKSLYNKIISLWKIMWRLKTAWVWIWIEYPH